MKNIISLEEKQKRIDAWEFALGLQRTDGFEPDGEYLDLIEKEINGEITLNEMKEIVLEKCRKKALEIKYKL